MKNGFQIIAKRRLWYAISLLIIVPGMISLFSFGLKRGIDFTGGSLLELNGRVEESLVRPVASLQGFKDVTVSTSGDNHTLIRYRDDSDATKREVNHQTFRKALESQGVSEVRFDNVGPNVSRDITRNALISVLLASLAIVLYVAWAFRNVPPPASPWAFGISAIVALLHDALLLIGVFSLLGKFFGVEIDALFVTAVLTVIGFSVHDTIVVFDRVRENLRREKKPFAVIVNDSILETFARSINTSLTVLLTLLALYLFGGQSIRLFVLALLIGIASGTYSSIFNASPLLVTWYNIDQRRKQKVSTPVKKR